MWFVLTRFPYDRLGLLGGFLLHVVWLQLLDVYAERNVRRRFAVVPYGNIEGLGQIDTVDWVTMKRPRLADARNCDAIVADFSAALPDEWEAFLADAALAGPDRLSGQAIVGIADWPGRARASLGKQLRFAAPGPGLFLPEVGWPTSSSPS